MGCASSKNSVQEIEIQDGVTKVKRSKNITSSNGDKPKTASAKSRDSGIQEMEEYNSPHGVVTELSDPTDQNRRPTTPELQLLGKNLAGKPDRMKSKTILDELQAQGLIQGSRVQSGGSAFEVNLDANPTLEPLAPIKKPPARLERLNSGKRRVTREELDRKMKDAEDRRHEFERSKSRIASQLAAHVARARQTGEGSDGENHSDTEDIHQAPRQMRSTMNLPPLPPRPSNLPPIQNSSKSTTQQTSITKQRIISDDFDDDLSSLEELANVDDTFNKPGKDDDFFMR